MDEEEQHLEEEISVKTEPVKKKRQMSEKQLEALARGRAKGKDVIRAKGALTREVKATTNTIQKIKEEEKVNEIEDLKKLNDINYIRKNTEDMVNKFKDIESKFSNIDTKFSGFLTEREQRKKAKDEGVVEKTIKANMPKVMSEVIYKDKLAKEMKSNPYYGRI